MIGCRQQTTITVSTTPSLSYTVEKTNTNKQQHPKMMPKGGKTGLKIGSRGGCFALFLWLADNGLALTSPQRSHGETSPRWAACSPQKARMAPLASDLVRMRYRRPLSAARHVLGGDSGLMPSSHPNLNAFVKTLLSPSNTNAGKCLNKRKRL